MSLTADEHRSTAPQQIRCAVITVSDTRTRQTDSGGDLLESLLVSAGFEVLSREIIPDEPAKMRPRLQAHRDDPACDAVLLTGGTGISSRDQTFETVSALLTKPLPGYGELFRMLSHREIGAAAMLSRAVAGLMDRTVVATMPGSPAAVRLAVEQLIVPELAHLVREARR